MATVKFYNTSTSANALDISSITYGGSFDTFSTRQVLSTIPTCGVRATESLGRFVISFFYLFLKRNENQLLLCCRKETARHIFVRQFFSYSNNAAASETERTGTEIL